MAWLRAWKLSTPPTALPPGADDTGHIMSCGAVVDSGSSSRARASMATVMGCARRPGHADESVSTIHSDNGVPTTRHHARRARKDKGPGQLTPTRAIGLSSAGADRVS